jgi:hypothetical protein
MLDEISLFSGFNVGIVGFASSALACPRDGRAMMGKDLVRVNWCLVAVQLKYCNDLMMKTRKIVDATSTPSSLRVQTERVPA